MHSKSQQTEGDDDPLPVRQAIAATLLKQHARLWPRFLSIYARLSRLPRGWRRRLARKAAVSLAGAALLLALGRGPAAVVHAANINVDEVNCTLVDAILSAENDASFGGCTAGSGADTITLLSDVTLTDPYGLYYESYSGLPLITTEITIEGGGYYIERDTADTDKFRLITVSSTGDLTLHNVKLSGGYAYSKYVGSFYTYYYGSGGAVESHGTLTIDRSTISGNTALDDGGGIKITDGVFYLTDSTVSYNQIPYDFNDSDGGGMRLEGESATITGSVIHNNTADSDGGGIDHDYGILRISHTVIRDNTSYTGDGGGIDGGDGPMYIENSTLTGNQADDEGGAIWLEDDALISHTTISNNKTIDGDGGGIDAPDADVTIRYSLFSGNYSAENGGGVSHYYGNLTILNSTFYDNEAQGSGGAVYADYAAMLSMINSTVSNNSADKGGGIASDGTIEIINTTITGNNAATRGGGVIHFFQTATFKRSIVSGNEAPEGREIFEYDVANTDSFNLFGYNGDSGLVNVTVGASDIVPGSGVGVSDILNTTIAANGGPQSGTTGEEEAMLTHALVNDSLAIDGAPSADCDDEDGLDQRGYVRNVDGDSTVSSNECDIGAFEYSSFPPGEAIYMTAAGPGTTGDGVNFGKEDILETGELGDWEIFFDGTDAGLTTKHDIDAIHVNGEDDIYLSFFQNKIKTSNLGQVLGTDILHYDGSGFSVYFDGSDVGLDKVAQEKIDGLHILDGDVSPIGGSCEAYLLISTFGTGKVPAFGGGTINFQGEDILGFCATNTGSNTTGFWHMVLDGSAAGMPKNSTDSISASDNGETIYLTTKGTFNVDSTFGGHSMVYVYDTNSGQFSGPIFSAPANGLNRQVDGLHIQ